MRQITGDLFELGKGKVICVTTNGVVKTNGDLTMGAGIAKEFNNRFPGLAKTLGSFVNRSGNRVYGLGEHAEYFIVSFPTKHHWRDNSDLELIEQSCMQLRALMADMEQFDEVYLPMPGCGLGGLDPNVVLPILEKHLDDRFILVHYKQQAKETPQMKQQTAPTQLLTVVFTGPRPQNLAGNWTFDDPINMKVLAKVTRDLEKLVLQNGTRIFINGFAAGFDLLAVRAVLDVQQKYPDLGIQLWAFIPYAAQRERIKGPWRNIYDTGLQRASEKIILFPDPVDKKAAIVALFERNKKMVDCMGNENAMLYSCHNGLGTGRWYPDQIPDFIFQRSAGGTAHTIAEVATRSKASRTFHPYMYNICPSQL